MHFFSVFHDVPVLPFLPFHVSELSKPTIEVSMANFEESIIEQGIGNMSLSEDIDPFDPQIHSALLKSVVKISVEKRHGYVALDNQKMPSIRANSTVTLGDSEFFCMESIGEGAYGKVFKAMKCNSNTNDTITDMDVVLKVQKPSRPWEYYICTEINKRLEGSYVFDGFMSIPRCYAFQDGSVFVSELQMFSLLDICNLVNQMVKTSVEIIAMYFTIEMLRILENLRKAQIIHGDIKPDNFLIQRKPDLNLNAANAHEMFSNVASALQIIDFGVSIDMSLFHKNQTFTHKFDKVDNRCPEMLEDKPWTYHVSLLQFFFLKKIR